MPRKKAIRKCAKCGNITFFISLTFVSVLLECENCGNKIKIKKTKTGWEIWAA